MGEKIKQHSAKIYYSPALLHTFLVCLSFMNKFYLSKRKEHGYECFADREREKDGQREKERRALTEEDVYNRRSTPKYRNYTTREPQLLDII
jgi:hypothetical protein